MSALRTAVLLGALTGLLVGLGYMVGGAGLALMALIFAGIMNFVSYFFSDKLALRMAGAKEVTREQEPHLHAMVEEVATLAGEAMLPWLSQIEGFEGLLMMSNEGDGTTVVITFWESREVADEHRAARAEFRDRITATVGVRVESVAEYDMTFADLGSWAVDAPA